MEKKNFFLTNMNIREKMNNSKNLEKIRDKESFIYKKGNKKINNSSFDLRKDIKVNKNVNIKKKENNFDSNNQKIYYHNINDGENIDKQNMIYKNVLSRTQTSFFNKRKNCDYSNKIFKHDENLFDNEQYQIIENVDNNKPPIINKEKGNFENNNNFKKNKLEYNYINQNNSFCVSINNNYNYNLSLNNYNNIQEQDDRENKINWNKKLNIINEEKKRMRTEYINDNKKDYNTINNKENKDEIINKKRQLFQIKKIHSSYILNNNNKNKSSIVAFLKPNTNLQNTFYMKRINKKSNDIYNNNDNSNDDYKNNYFKNSNNNTEENKNKNKGKLKESNDLWSNDEDNSIEDKFTFNIKKNNINYNNNEEICELDIPASNINLNINNDQKTAQFPDVINKENCYNYIPQHLTKNNDSDNKNNNLINNNKQNEKKVYTKGRYDYLLLEETIKNEKY